MEQLNKLYSQNIVTICVVNLALDYFSCIAFAHINYPALLLTLYCIQIWVKIMFIIILRGSSNEQLA